MNIKELLKKTRKELTDAEIFTSEPFGSYLSRKARQVHKDWHIEDVPCSVTFNQELEWVAMTNNAVYLINAGHEFFASPRDTRAKRLCGVLLHEIGHRIFTCFSYARTYQQALYNGKLYPPPAQKLNPGNQSELLEFISTPRGSKIVSSLTATISNILEDGRIEYLLQAHCSRHYVLLNGLSNLREAAFEGMDGIDTITEKVENGQMTPYSAILQVMLHYARFGEIKSFDPVRDKDNEIVKRFSELRCFVDEALDSITAVSFYAALNSILVCMWDVMKAYIDKFEEQTNRNSSKTGSKGKSGSTGSSKGSGGSSDDSSDDSEGTRGSGDDEENDDSDDSEGTGGSDDKEETGNSDDSEETGSSDDKEKTGDGEENDDDATEEEKEEAMNRMLEELVKELEETIQGLTPNSEMTGDGTDSPEIGSKIEESISTERKATKERGSGSFYRKSTETHVMGIGKNSTRDNFREESNVNVDLTRILNAVVEEKADGLLEKKIKDDLLNFKQKTDFGSVHRGVTCCFTRHAITENNRQEFARISPPLLRIAKNMAKKTDFFMDEESPITVKGKYDGRKFDASKVCRNDFRYFEKDIRIEDAPSIAVGVVLDESGSMHGLRSQYAKAMALTMFEYCSILDIPISIIGHSTNGYTSDVEIFVYSDFDKADENDKYRLMNVSARSSNRDGYPIRLMMERLLAQDAEKKLLVVVSDGEPSACGYYGTAACKDLEDIVKQCEKADIGLIAAAIGDDKENIRAIYGERHFLDISKLEELPARLTSQIRKLLK